MKIYFACSITGGREFEATYQIIVDELVREGHQVLTAHLAEASAGEREAALGPREVYLRDIDWIIESDVLIAEVSVPSHGVGYEIGFALGKSKLVLALHQWDRKVSKMIGGNPDTLLQVKTYQDSAEALQMVSEFLAQR
jgi:2'-deoxynucleoside 5'-phosphate N-hydrolase